MTSLHIIGPCSLESWEQIQPVAQLATNLGIGFLRMQIFKPRTRLKSFQGLGVEGLEIFKLVRQNFPHLKFVSEACSMEHLRVLQNQVEVLQIGARNMQNFELLKEVARLFEKSSWNYVLLKRGFANTFEEWMGAVEYLEEYIPREKIILCERGSRQLTSPTGVSLDFICALKAQREGFRVVIDPSHGTKERSYVGKLAKASWAMGFDVMIEVHPRPTESVSDAAQAIGLDECEALFRSFQ